MATSLRDLALYLKELFAREPAVGSIVGRTSLRDALVDRMKCSELQAEQWIDSMVQKKMLVFEGKHGEPGVWHIRPDAEVPFTEARSRLR